MRKQADALKVCPTPDACLLVMAQRPSRLLGSPETRSLIFLIKNSPDQVEGYLDYLQPACLLVMAQRPSRLLGLPETKSLIFLIKKSPDQVEGYLNYLQPPRELLEIRHGTPYTCTDRGHQPERRRMDQPLMQHARPHKRAHG
jgi:hypothetical protein